MIRKLALSVALLNCIGITVMATHTGRVYIDDNHNGICDNGEKGLKGVMVSDGLNVVKTLEDGLFSLPGHAKESFIFITIPSGFKTENKHYHRINIGTESYEFALQPYDGGIRKDGSHQFVHISDTEILDLENQREWVSDIYGYVNNEQAAFIIHTGDICYEKGMTSHIKLMNSAIMGVPVFYCIGNHDLVKGSYGEEMFERIYGPVYYSFDVGSTHYIVTPMLSGDFKPKYTKEDVYRWLKNDLKQIPQGKPVVFFSHDLPTHDNRFVYGISEREQLILDDYNLKAWLFGHWHINYMRKWDNAFAISTAAADKGGIDHSANAYRVMHIDQNGNFKSELRYTYLNKKMQISSPAEGVDTAFTLKAGIPLVVNVYSSDSPVKEVTYTCLMNGKVWQDGKRLQQQTDWCWNAHIPLTVADEGKKITLEIKARFNSGEVVEQKRFFIYSGAAKKVKLEDNWENLLGNAQHISANCRALQQPLKLSWVTNVGANIYMTSPLVHQGKIYIASIDENLKGEAHIYCLDGKNGKLLWKYQVRNSIKNTIAIDCGQVLAQDAQGYVYAVDAESGKLTWEKQLSINHLPSLVEGIVASNGKVYAGTGKGLCCVDVKTGRVVWQNIGWTQNMGTTSTLSVTKDELIASTQWGALYANELVTGKLKWKSSVNGLRHRAASAAVHGDLLYIISFNSFFILNADSGNVVVRKELPFWVDVTSTPLLTDNEIIFGSSKDGLIAIDGQTFELKWKLRTNDALVLTSPYAGNYSESIETSPIWAGGVVYVAASDGIIYGVDKENGQLIWRYKTGAPILGSLAVSGNALIAADFGGNVYTFVGN